MGAEVLSRYIPSSHAPMSDPNRSILRLIFRLMMSNKTFVIEHYSTTILSDETKYNTLCALCLEQSSLKTLIWVLNLIPAVFQ